MLRNQRPADSAMLMVRKTLCIVATPLIEAVHWLRHRSRYPGAPEVETARNYLKLGRMVLIVFPLDTILESYT